MEFVVPRIARQRETRGPVGVATLLNGGQEIDPIVQHKEEFMIQVCSKSPSATTRLGLMTAVLLATMAAVTAIPSVADAFREQQQLVDKAKMTIEAFAADPSARAWGREFKHEARALFIVPQFLRGAFVFGGAGGSGVLVVRDEKTKQVVRARVLHHRFRQFRPANRRRRVGDGLCGADSERAGRVLSERF